MILRKAGFPSADTPGEIELVDEIQKHISNLSNYSSQIFPNVKLGKWAEQNGLVSIELKQNNDTISVSSYTQNDFNTKYSNNGR